MYVVSVLLMFFMAAGLGATAAVGVGWQFERAGLAPGHACTATPERGELETIGGSAEGSGATTVHSPDEKEYEASFTHRANEDNSRGDYTYISDPSIDGDANAIVFASVASDGESAAASYEHDIGVWYTPVAHKWAIFNQDLAAVPAGATFEVIVPHPSATSFVHRATLLNTAGNYT